VTPMEPAPFDRLAAALHQEPSVEDGLDRLAAVCVELTQMSATAIVVQTGEQPPSAFAASSTGFATLAQSEFTLGEGPVLEAITSSHPVLVDDLATVGRWPQLTPALVEAGVRAVYALPLRIDPVELGALPLYRDRRGPVPPPAHARTREVADALTHLLFVLLLASDEDRLAWPLDETAQRQAVVHQATGMIASELGCSTQEALIRLRARAYADDQPLTATARRVINRELRFDR
jgi:transcriptional regulator with GAF, ATPase, and Fis domain